MNDNEQNPFYSTRKTEKITDDHVVAAEFVQKKSRGHWAFVLIAWLIIASLVTLIFVSANFSKREASKEAVKSSLVILSLQGKYIIGATQFTAEQNEDIEPQLESMNMGPVDHRLCYTIMMNEVGDATTASQELDSINQLIAEVGHEQTDEQLRTNEILQRLYQDYELEAWEAPSLDESDRAHLVSELGWFGRLALHVENCPEQDRREKVTGEAKSVFYALLSLTVLMLLVILLGLIGLIFLTVQLCIGNLTLRTENFTGNGRIYIEAFAVWFLLFLGLSFLSHFVFPGDSLLLSFVLSICSLGCLYWPVLRQVPVGEILSDLGFKCKNIFVEIGTGFMCYICAIPVLGALIILMSILQGLFGTPPDLNDFKGEPASHPIMEWAVSAGVLGFLLIGLVTVVGAPLVEETVFRGLFYRYFRDESYKLGRLLSCTISGILNGLIFAAIHPQGIMAIPILAGLAFAFSLVREWRGSLYAPMTMHAIHNGSLTLGLYLVFL